jgi:hypothetical protein
VSIATVSRVLNLDPSLSVTAETKQRIFEIAEQMDYQKKGTKRTRVQKVALVHWFTEEEELCLDTYIYKWNFFIKVATFDGKHDFTAGVSRIYIILKCRATAFVVSKRTTPYSYLLLSLALATAPK